MNNDPPEESEDFLKAGQILGLEEAIKLMGSFPGPAGIIKIRERIKELSND